MQNASCVLVPGGFGDRGVGGMILAAKYARENNVPYLGICLGMQISVVEFARSVSKFCQTLEKMGSIIFATILRFWILRTLFIGFGLGKCK